MFENILKFEQALAEYTGAPYVIMTDCCTHAIEMCMRYENIRRCFFTAYTYLSVPMTMHKLGIKYELEEMPWLGEYQFHGTRIWDSARRLERGMYRKGAMQCLSFGWDKPLNIGRGGAILLDDNKAFETLMPMRYDGRDLTISPWQKQQQFRVGYHYRPTPEEAIRGLELLEGVKATSPKPVPKQYPNLRLIRIVD